MKSLHDIKKIREDRSSFSATEMHAFADNIVNESTEIIASFLYFNYEKDIETATIRFEPDADGKNIINCVLYVNEVGKTEDDLTIAFRLEDLVTPIVYEANKKKILAIIMEILQAKGFAPQLNEEGPEEITISLI